MARFLYGGGGDGDIVQPTGLPYTNAPATVYSARTAGAAVTDLQSLAGATLPGAAVTSDAYGQVAFYGPDNFVGTLWLQFGTGPRWALSPKAVDLTAAQVIASQRSADDTGRTTTRKAALPKSAANPLGSRLADTLDPLVIPRFASLAARNAAFPAPVSGDRCWRSDLLTDELYDGTRWRTHTTDAPWTVGAFTITPATGTFTKGSGALVCRYLMAGSRVDFVLQASFTTDTAYGTGNWTIGLPFTASSGAVLLTTCSGMATSGGGRFPVGGQLETATTLSLWGPTSSTSSAFVRIGSAGVGGAWGNGSVLRLAGVTELA